MSIFNFTLLKKNTTNTTNLLLASYAVGYVYVKIANLIPININIIFDNICICVLAVVVAFIIAKVYQGKYIQKLCEFLKIGQTVNNNTWVELLDAKNEMNAKITLDNGEICYGYIYHIGEDESPVMISLAAYKIDDRDYCLENNKLLLISISKVAKIELIYNSESFVVKDLQDYIDARK